MKSHGIGQGSSDCRSEFLNTIHTKMLFLWHSLNTFYGGVPFWSFSTEVWVNKRKILHSDHMITDASIIKGIDYTTQINDTRDDFDFDNFPFLDNDVPHSTSYGVYISQLIPFARASSHVADFNTRKSC